MRQLCYTSATQLVSDYCTEELWGNESIVGNFSVTYRLAYAITCIIILISNTMKKDFLNTSWAAKKGEVVSHVFWKEFTTLFLAGILDVLACNKSMRALPEPRYIFSYILNRVVVGERAELFKSSFGLWTCHMHLIQLSLGIYQSVLFVWNFSCTVICQYSCFWIVCSNNLKFQRIILFY